MLKVVVHLDQSVSLKNQPTPVVPPVTFYYTIAGDDNTDNNPCRPLHESSTAGYGSEESNGDPPTPQFSVVGIFNCTGVDVIRWDK